MGRGGEGERGGEMGREEGEGRGEGERGGEMGREEGIGGERRGDGERGERGGRGVSQSLQCVCSRLAGTVATASVQREHHNVMFGVVVSACVSGASCRDWLEQL